MDTALNWPWTKITIALYYVLLKVTAFQLNKSHKILIKVWVYKPSFLVPGGPQAYISSRCQGWAFFGFWQDREATSLGFLEKKLLKIYFRKYNLKLQLWKAWTLETQSYNLLRINLTGFKCLLWYQVFINWTGIQLVFEFRKGLLRIFSYCLVKYCNVKGERVDFVFRKGTTLLMVNNKW